MKLGVLIRHPLKPSCQGEQEKKEMIKLFFLTCSIIGIWGQEVEYDVKAWTQAAEYLQSAMDPKADKCNHFYDFVCGKYNSSTQDAQEYERALLDKQAATIKVLEEAIGKIKHKSPKTSRYAKAIGAFYDHCSSQTPDSTKLIKQLYDAVEQRLGPFPLFGPVPDKFNVWHTSGLMERHADTELGIAGGAVVPAEVSEVLTALNTTTIPVVLLVPAPVSGDVEFNSTKTKEVIMAMASATGKKVDESKVDDLVARVGQLHDDIVNIGVESEGTGRIDSLTNVTDKHPFLNQYFDGLLEPGLRKEWSNSDSASVYLQNEEWLNAFNDIVNNKTHKADAWQAFAFLTVVQSFQELYFGEYNSDNAVIISDPTSIKERCLEFVVRTMTPGAARLLFDHIKEDIGRWRSEIQLMGRNIFSAFRFMLNSVDWLDEGEKVKINEKVDAIKFNPGLPDWIMNDDKVMAHMNDYNESLSLYENDLRYKMHKFDTSARQLVDGASTEDPPPTFKLNSQYNPAIKQIDVFLGFILPPFYQPTYPLAVQYGGFGFVIGHELGHAFDNDGVYDRASPNKPWLKPETLKEFEKRKACLIQQYSQNCYKKLGLCVNGEKTIGDNIADITGLKAAYLAYKYVAKTIGGDIRVPQLEKFNSDQIFFMSAVRQWCTKNDPGIFTLLLDEHTPDRPRMEMAVKNVPQFASAFKCPANSGAVLTKTCPIWGDFTGPAKVKKPKGDNGEQPAADGASDATDGN